MCKPIDAQQIRHELAVEYAKISLKKAMANGDIYRDGIPEACAEAEFLLDEYCSTYAYYLNIPDKQIEKQINDDCE